MDRIQEFNEIIEKLKSGTDENPILRNRLATTKEEKEKRELVSESSAYNFSKSFLNECTLTNSTLLQLAKKLKEISQKSEQFNFSFASNKTATTTVDQTREIDEALNICSMNISIMKKKLEDFKVEKVADDSSFFSKLFKQSKDQISFEFNPILEHCRLIILFLESRIGRITEDLEAYKLHKKNREKLLRPERSPITTKHTVITSNQNHNVSGDTMSMLQVENSRMIEEMSRGLFEALSNTETQILELSRLQATLQNHLTVQHDLTCRLFEDSITTIQDTQKGNEYLKKTGKDSSTMRRFLVTLILAMSLLLLLLHYFNK